MKVYVMLFFIMLVVSVWLEATMVQRNASLKLHIMMYGTILVASVLLGTMVAYMNIR